MSFKSRAGSYNWRFWNNYWDYVADGLDPEEAHKKAKEETKW